MYLGPYLFQRELAEMDVRIIHSLSLLALLSCFYLLNFELVSYQPVLDPDSVPGADERFHQLMKPDEMSIPYSNITTHYQMLKNGIVREEGYSGVSHSLENRFNATIHPETTWKLPKTLHFIWVGSLIREKYIKAVNLFAKHNPNYKVGSLFFINVR